MKHASITVGADLWKKRREAMQSGHRSPVSEEYRAQIREIHESRGPVTPLSTELEGRNTENGAEEWGCGNVGRG